jgi:hypothetical protein
MMALKNNNASHLKAICVGTQDFIMEGTQKECVKWLKEFEKPVTTFEGFGHEVWMILRGTAAKPAEEFAKAYGAAFGVGGLGSLIYTGVAAFTPAANTAFQAASSGTAAAAYSGAAFNFSDANLDSALQSVIERVAGKTVHVRLSCAKGCYSNAKSAKDSVVKLPAGLSARFFAGALSSLKW